jgi:hypothetical protein
LIHAGPLGLAGGSGIGIAEAGLRGDGGIRHRRVVAETNVVEAIPAGAADFRAHFSRAVTIDFGLTMDGDGEVAGLSEAEVDLGVAGLVTEVLPPRLLVAETGVNDVKAAVPDVGSRHVISGTVGRHTVGNGCLIFPAATLRFRIEVAFEVKRQVRPALRADRHRG